MGSVVDGMESRELLCQLPHVLDRGKSKRDATKHRNGSAAPSDPLQVAFGARH